MSQSAKNLPSLYFFLLIVCYLLFIAAASFYLTGNIPSTQSAINRLLFRLGDFRVSLHNLRDISTNILLYMPLGFLVAMFIACTKRITLINIHLCWGVLISLCVEITQAFIGRFSDFTDIVSNGTGYVIGFVIALQSINRFGMRPAALLGLVSEENTDTLNTLSGIRFVYLTVAFVTCLLPLDITVSFADIYGKLVAVNGAMPRLIVDPFYHYSTLANDLQYLVLRLLMFLPLAFLSAFIQIHRSQPSVFIPAFHCLLFGLSVELANLFIRSGRSDIFVPIMGFCGGLLVAYTVVYFNRLRGGLIRSEHNREQLYYLLSIGLLYCIFLLAVSLSPYDFELSLSAIRNKLLVESNFMPFRAHFSTRSVAAAVDIVREVILYVPLGVIVALVFRTTKKTAARHYSLLVAAVLGFTFAIVIELLQLTVVGRYVDITDCLLGAIGCLAGARLSLSLVSSIRGENKM